MSLSSCPSAFSYCACFVCKKDNWMRKLEGILCFCLDGNWHGLVFQCLGISLISKDIRFWKSWECCQLKNHISITINNAINLFKTNMDCVRIGRKKSMASAAAPAQFCFAHNLTKETQVCCISWQHFKVTSHSREKAGNCDSNGNCEERWGLPPWPC